MSLVRKSCQTSVSKTTRIQTLMMLPLTSLPGRFLQKLCCIWVGTCIRVLLGLHGPAVSAGGGIKINIWSMYTIFILYYFNCSCYFWIKMILMSHHFIFKIFLFSYVQSSMYLCKFIHSFIYSRSPHPHADAQRGDTVLLYHMRQVPLLPPESRPAHTDTHGREPFLLRPVRQGFPFTCRSPLPLTQVSHGGQRGSFSMLTLLLYLD